MATRSSTAYHHWLELIKESGRDAMAIRWVKAIHTVIFLSLLACVIDITIACLRNRFNRRTKVAVGAVAIEGAIFALNGRHCPLTVLVEDLGDEHGQVTDIFLPDVLARNIFTISMSMLGTGAGVLVIRRLRRHGSL
jgi:hypothetical protein